VLRDRLAIIGHIPCRPAALLHRVMNALRDLGYGSRTHHTRLDAEPVLKLGERALIGGKEYAPRFSRGNVKFNDIQSCQILFREVRRLTIFKAFIEVTREIIIKLNITEPHRAGYHHARTENEKLLV